MNILLVKLVKTCLYYLEIVDKRIQNIIECFHKKIIMCD